MTVFDQTGSDEIDDTVHFTIIVWRHDPFVVAWRMTTYWNQYFTDARGVMGRCGTDCRSDRAFPGASRQGLIPLRARNRPFNAIARQAVTRISSDGRGGAGVDKPSYVIEPLNIVSDKSNRRELRILHHSIAGFNSILPPAVYF